MESVQADPRYPIGKYQPMPYSDEQRNEWIADIEFMPRLLEQAISNLDSQQLHTPYRDGGWTVHELVHHMADSHMNAFIRFKLGYTEDNPTIRPYDENLWVKTEDVAGLPVNLSVTILHALHQRWVKLLKSFNESDWEKTIYHPEHKKTMSLWFMLGTYAWHSKHHVAHITSLRERQQW